MIQGREGQSRINSCDLVTYRKVLNFDISEREEGREDDKRKERGKEEMEG